MKINKVENTSFTARIKIIKPDMKILQADSSNSTAISRNLSSLGSSMTSSSTVVQSRNLPWFNNQYIDPRKLIIKDIKDLKNEILKRHSKIPS